MKVDNYFGGCPQCGETDGYTNTGRTHVFYCIKHKTRWVAGANLFSCWRDETEEEQIAAWNAIGLEEFEGVRPIYDDTGQHEAQDAAKDLPHAKSCRLLRI